MERTSKHLVVNHPGKTRIIYHGYLLDRPDTYKATVNGKDFYITKTTVIPSVQSGFLLENTLIRKGDVVLDIGTGSGVQAIFAAEKASKVVATDISEDAVYDTKQNVVLHGLEDKIDVRLGDLFGPVKDGEKFDVIIFNIEYPYDEKTTALWKVHERFFANVRKYMKPDAKIYYQGGWIRNIPKVKAMANTNGLSIIKMDMIYTYKQARQPIVFKFVTNQHLTKLKAWKKRKKMKKKEEDI